MGAVFVLRGCTTPESDERNVRKLSLHDAEGVEGANSGTGRDSRLRGQIPMEPTETLEAFTMDEGGID